MRKYFGTDGIRRIANIDLTPELVYKVAKAGAYVLSKHTDHAPTILIGRDTRLSGTLIESAMTAGFLSYGANVKLLGVIPTPAVAYLTKKLKAAGIVQACEGIKGGYTLVKNPEIISLFDIVSSMEVTMKINRCLESDGFCSRNATDYCNVHKALLKVQRTYEDALKSVSIADLI